MYCIKCGVELADSERVCPLCGTRVFHPDLPCGQGEPPYPPADHPRHEEVSRIGVLFVISVCMLLPAGHHRAVRLAHQRDHRLVRLCRGRIAAAVYPGGAASVV